MEQNNYFRSVLKGTIGTMIFSLIGIIVVSAIMTKCKLSFSIRSVVLIIVFLISLSLGSIIAAKKNGSKGLLVGLGVGLSVYIVYFIVISILNNSVIFTMYDFGKMAVSVIIACVAGVLGVNL